MTEIDECKTAGQESDEDDEYWDPMTEVDESKTADKESNDDGKLWDPVTVINKNMETQIDD